jgi:hypothetical protein
VESLQPFQFDYWAKLSDAPTPAVLERALDRLTELTGLTPIPGLRVVNVNAEGGFDAVQVFGESHCAIFGHDRHAYATVFSCRAFDHQAARQALQEQLGGQWQAKQIRPAPDAPPEEVSDDASDAT